MPDTRYAAYGGMPDLYYGRRVFVNASTPAKQAVLSAVDPVWRTFYEIAARIAMDRTVIRRTLHELVDDGLVESRKEDTEYRIVNASTLGAYRSALRSGEPESKQLREFGDAALADSGEAGS